MTSSTTKQSIQDNYSLETQFISNEIVHATQTNNNHSLSVQPIKLTHELNILNEIEFFQKIRKVYTQTGEQPIQFIKFAIKQRKYDEAYLAITSILDSMRVEPKFLSNQDQESLLGLKMVVNARLYEMKNGVYNMLEMAKAAQQCPFLQNADYRTAVRIQYINETKRYGVVCQEDISSGSLILAEKAIGFIPQQKESLPHPYNKYNKDKQSYYHWKLSIYLAKLAQIDKSISTKIQRMYRGGKAMWDFIEQHYADLKIELQTKEALDMLQVVLTNHIRSSRGPISKRSKRTVKGLGLWHHIAHINHGCVGNVNIHIIGDFAFVVSTRMIARGQEITFSYRPDQTYPTNVINLEKFFVCTCTDCEIFRNNSVLVQIRLKLEELIKRSIGMFQNFVRENASVQQWVVLSAELDLLLRLSRQASSWINPRFGEILVIYAEVSMHLGSKISMDNTLIGQACVKLIEEAVQVFHMNNNERCVEVSRQLCQMHSKLYPMPSEENQMYKQWMLQLFKLYVGGDEQYYNFLYY
eukprot:TRINITY_DN6025_c0_g2_i2.p1 TRINITY_DN6025_c0_g2~~TRINITY_DN6025_c0_g2_i2.p1  ORF type:complete len:578 (-),score=16.71 TRINITY_DN6025_c0_g2_i2:167-1741(-)